jgi:hypothetical protein
MQLPKKRKMLSIEAKELRLLTYPSKSTVFIFFLLFSDMRLVRGNGKLKQKKTQEHNQYYGIPQETVPLLECDTLDT